MKPEKDLGALLRRFLGEHLPNHRRASPLTVRAYRDALKLLLLHVADARKCSVAELRLTDVDCVAVLSFLKSLEDRRGNGVTTRNHRLAAIRSFFRFVSAGAPEAVEQCTQILELRPKRGDSRSIDYLTVDEMAGIMQQVPLDSPEGRRDDLLLRFLYNTGARVQEALDVRPCDLHLDSASHVLLRGKGRKERVCPLWVDTVRRLRRFLVEHSLDATQSVPLFTGRHNRVLTRFGIAYILQKYVKRSLAQCPSLARKKLHPHTMRHTTAMHLLQSGVDINTIRCWLGHASVATTNRYVEIDLEMKRRALEGVKSPRVQTKPAIAEAELLFWLEHL